jgi:hypothetical protein
MQKTRLMRFSPELDKLSQNYDLYHIIFTVPNTNANMLSLIVDNIFDRFRYLIRYFKLDAKAKGIDFTNLGYVGCVRSLEITYNNLKNTYHPHLHCIFAFRKNLDFVKDIFNQFSYSYGEFRTAFSQFEILLQKIWYLLITHNEVNLSNINTIPIGYSVKVQNMDESTYYEVFKYAMKLFDDKNYFMPYPQFKVLYETLYNRRTIQGYGLLHNIQCNDEIDDTVKATYYNYIKQLQSIEIPTRTSDTITEIIRSPTKKQYRMITGKTVFTLLEQNKIEPATPDQIIEYQKYKQETELQTKYQNYVDIQQQIGNEKIMSFEQYVQNIKYRKQQDLSTILYKKERQKQRAKELKEKNKQKSERLKFIFGNTPLQEAIGKSAFKADTIFTTKEQTIIKE